jgi:chemotaxis protein methyltransferase CheR
MNRNLTDIELSMVSEVIVSKTGLYFPVERRDILSQNLASAASEFGYNNMTEFINWILSSTLNKEQIEILASFLTISETYFWREPQVFEAFSQNILTEYIDSENERGKSINIWCAGCSTGEEAYSIAIALHRTVPQIKEWNIKILATDINTKSLQKAETGIYGSWSFRNSPLWLKSNYFRKLNSKEYEIIPEIKKMVTFSSFNLTNENFLSSICKDQKMDIIFCRNVLMYFTNEWVTKIIQNIFQTLSKKGWLIVSSSELSSPLFPQFSNVNFPGAILYRKGEDDFSYTYINLIDAQSQPNLNITQLLSSDIEAVNNTFSLDSTSPDLNKDESINTETLFKPEAKLENSTNPQLQLNSKENSLKENINSIRSLANKGHLKEALSDCNEAIESEKLSTGLYFLRATILQELNKSHEAIKSLKQAIYINPNYVMGHFTLGNLFTLQGNVKNAKQHFNNALELLNTFSNDDFPEESDGLSAKYLKGVIHSNLKI